MSICQKIYNLIFGAWNDKREESNCKKIVDKNQCPKSGFGHRFEVSSPIDTVEVCIYCGESQDCRPYYT